MVLKQRKTKFLNTKPRVLCTAKRHFFHLRHTKTKENKILQHKNLCFLHSEESLLPDSFQLSWFSFVYVIPKQRETQFFNTNSFGFLHSKEPLLPNSFRLSWFSFVYVIPKQRKTKLFLIHFGYFGFSVLRSC